jgi:hypothetical protein
MSSALKRNQASHIYSLDLTDCNGSYETLLCDDSTGGKITVRSCNDLVCDYCFDWQSMTGVTLDQSDDVSYISACIDHNIIRITIPFSDISFNLSIESDSFVQHACALIIPTDKINNMQKIDPVMHFSDACRLGIVIPKNKITEFENNQFDEEIELDQILDQMTKDGTIAIKPVSTGTIWLKSIGSALFMKYLALRTMLQSWWNYFGTDGN